MAKAKRKALSQKIRFEVFKRDSFTCVYCGRKAPDVVLQVDHIVPVAQGGTNDILNLVTSCVDCNQGKSDRKLSDQSVVEKQRREMELRQERLEQIRMMGEWQRGLVTAEDASLEEADKLYAMLVGAPMYATERLETRKMIKRFGLASVLEGIRIGMDTYDDGLVAIEKLGGICYNNSSPEMKLRCHILNKMKRNFADVNIKTAAMLLDRGRRVAGLRFLEAVFDWINNGCGTTEWRYFRSWLEDYVEIFERENQ